MEAIRHGADAVYIGAPQFGARAAAGNSVDDIGRLTDFAHRFGAKVYVTLNTILYDTELADAERMVASLLAVGTDAFIVQDMAMVGIVRKVAATCRPQTDASDLLHASTQMDNRTPEQVAWLLRQGFRQAVLARELSLDEIRAVHTACPAMRLEAFVHGALCTSLSGRCYVSEALFGRSANRGCCAQVCRMTFNLEAADGTVLVRDRHLLSLKDLCQLDALADLADAGVVSFKIEGRLKDIAYVKNVTAAYSEALNALCKAQPDRYRRASRGQVELKFRPDVAASFNRGFTHYFLYGRNMDIFSFDTPKVVGQPIGTVRDISLHRQGLIRMALRADAAGGLANGDGLCFFNRNRRLVGFRVNRVEGDAVVPHIMPRDLLPGMPVYRNFDKRFHDILAAAGSAERYIPVDIRIDGDGSRFRLTMTDGKQTATTETAYDAELARTHQTENVQRQLSRLGDTVLRARSVSVDYAKNYFLPSSLLSQWRRELVSAFLNLPAATLPQPQPAVDDAPPTAAPHPLSYIYNVSNRMARTFYEEQGFGTPEPAFELQHRRGVPLMFCRHCLRYAMGWCQQRQTPTSAPPQLYLRLENGERLRLDFDCKACQMLVVRE